MAHNEEWVNSDLQKIRKAFEAMDSNKDKVMSDMENEGKQDIDNDDKSMEANKVDNEHENQFSSLESNPVPSTNSFKSYLNLPDIPFDLLMKMLSITDLRRLTQVSSSWKNRIMENFLNNPANHKTLRARAWSRRVLGLWMAPSNEEITNVIWLSKYDLALFVMGISPFFFQ